MQLVSVQRHNFAKNIQSSITVAQQIYNTLTPKLLKKEWVNNFPHGVFGHEMEKKYQEKSCGPDL